MPVREIDKNSFFWQYLSPSQKGLVEVGFYLLNDYKKHPDFDINDYSYLVFPFAKAYEGFLKQLFLDLGFITEAYYESDHFRIGKALNPHLERIFRGESIYDKLLKINGGKELADGLWDVWRRGRNLVFHYFPHNIRSLSEIEAETIINDIIDIMEKSVNQCCDRLKSRG